MILLCRNHITPPQLCESDEEGREREREERGERRKWRRAGREDDRQNTHAGTIEGEWRKVGSASVERWDDG